MTMARIVHNHTTFIGGLEKIIKQAATSPLIGTITPGRLNKANTSTRKSMELKVCVSAGMEKPLEQRSGASTHKVLARKGQLVQDIFFVLRDKGGPLDDYSNFANHLRETLKGQDCTVTNSVSARRDTKDDGSDDNDVTSRVARDRQYDRKGTKSILEKVDWW